MPTPRKPTSILQLSGSAKKHKDRIAARAGEPVPDPTFGDAPAHLSAHQTEIWNEIVSEIPPRVATKSDRKVVEIAVRMTEKMRAGSATSADYATLTRCLSQLGMTPADRSKIRTSGEDPEDTAPADPFADFLPDSKELLDLAQAN